MGHCWRSENNLGKPELLSFGLKLKIFNVRPFFWFKKAKNRENIEKRPIFNRCVLKPPIIIDYFTKKVNFIFISRLF